MPFLVLVLVLASMSSFVFVFCAGLSVDAFANVVAIAIILSRAFPPRPPSPTFLSSPYTFPFSRANADYLGTQLVELTADVVVILHLEHTIYRSFSLNDLDLSGQIYHISMICMI